MEFECLLILYFEVTKERMAKAMAGTYDTSTDHAYAFFPNIHELQSFLRGRSPVDYLFADEIPAEVASRWPCLRMK